MRKTKRLAIVIVTAAIPAIAGDALACENDAQCKGDRICANGTCVAPPERDARTVAPVGATIPSAGTQPPAPPVTTAAPPMTTAAPPVTTAAPPMTTAAPPWAPQAGAQAGWAPGAQAPPQLWTPPPPPATRRRVGLLVAGCVLGGVGVVGLPIGGVFMARSADPSPGIGVLVVSGAMVAASIPMIIVGARKVPVEPEQRSARGWTVQLAPQRGGLAAVGIF